MRRLGFILLVLGCISCSTTRVLSEGQLRLSENEIELNPKGELSSSAIAPYLRQQVTPGLLFGWDPFMSLYNWGNKPESIWRRIGTAPVVFNPDLVVSSQENILKRLEYLGYYNASVEPSIISKGKTAKVHYLVNTGERKRIDSLAFDIPDGELAINFILDAENVSIKEGDYLSEAALEAETVRGAKYYRSKGYYDFNKNNYFFEADTLGDKTILHYSIKSYTRNETEENDRALLKYHIGKVKIHHPSDIRFRPALLRRLNIIKPGDLWNEELINNAYFRFAALNLFNSVAIGISPTDSALLDCDIKLNGSDVLGFKINAELSTNSSSLLGASPQLSFYHKNLFHGGERLNVSMSGNWQFVPGQDVYSSELAASASLSIPIISKNSKSRYIPRADIKASYNYQDRPEYHRNIAAFSYGHSGQLGQNFFYQFQPLQLSLVTQAQVSEDFYETLMDNPYLWDSFMDQIDLGAGMMLYYTTDSNIVPKGAYHFSRFNLDLSGNFLSLFKKYMPIESVLDGHTLFGMPYKQYVRAEYSMGKVFRFGLNERSALALRLLAGIGRAYGNSSALTFEKQFYSGGASSMRAWQVRTLGPGSSPRDEWFIIPSQTGDMKLEADLEFRFPVVWKLEGALFAEAGNIWLVDELKNENFIDSIAADWGLGLRVNLDFILLRLDAGFKLHDPAREQKWLAPADWFKRDGAAIHFGVGYPF